VSDDQRDDRKENSQNRKWGIDHFDLQRKQIICPDCLDTVPIRYCLYCDRTDRVGLNTVIIAVHVIVVVFFLM
jgi:hypothetical protein